MPTIIKKTKALRVYDEIQRDIIEGILPQSSKLPMEFIKKKYKVGYSPIREALTRLVAEGLVDAEAQCGFRVAPISLNDFKDLYFLRQQIEILAITQAIQKGSTEWEAEVLSQWHLFSSCKNTKKLDESHWWKMQKEFLMTLIKGCQSRWLINLSSHLYDQALRYRRLCLHEHFHKPLWRKHYFYEKEKLMKSILERNTKKAIHLLNEGWKNITDAIEKILTKKRDNDA